MALYVIIRSKGAKNKAWIGPGRSRDAPSLPINVVLLLDAILCQLTVFLECSGAITGVKTGSFPGKVRYNLALFCIVDNYADLLPWEPETLDANRHIAQNQHKLNLYSA